MAYCCCCFKGPQTSICWPMWILLQWDCVWFRCESPTWEKCFHQLTGLWIWGLRTSIVGSHFENMSVLQVHCQTASRVSCNLRVKSNTCYCCDLYNCGKYVCERVPFGYIPPRIFSANRQIWKTTTMLCFTFLKFWFIFACMVCASIPEIQLCSKEHLCLFMFQRASSYGTSE